MGVLMVTRVIAVMALGLAVFGILIRLQEIMKRPYKLDLARPRGSRWRAVLYAFTLGMAPWEKESGRQHWVAYLRGVAFHIGVFMSFAVLLVSPWIDRLPGWLTSCALLVTGVGALAGFAGVAMRWLDHNERVLSVPDDYFSVILTSLFVTFASVALFASPWLPAFYVVSALTLIYIPFSKTRHCVFFFYSKFFFGESFGRRGVIGQH